MVCAAAVIPPNAVPVNINGCPTPRFAVLVHDIRLVPVVVSVHSMTSVASTAPVVLVNVGTELSACITVNTVLYEII